MTPQLTQKPRLVPSSSPHFQPKKKFPSKMKNSVTTCTLFQALLITVGVTTFAHCEFSSNKQSTGSIKNQNPNNRCCNSVDPISGTLGDVCISESPCNLNQTGDTFFSPRLGCCDTRSNLIPYANSSDIMKCVNSFQYAKVNFNQLFSILATSLLKFKTAITSEAEFMMFVAQMAVESKGFTALREEACIKKQPPPETCRYSGPAKDQCNKNTPNEFYFGRGYIHLTGCHNYRAASFDLYGTDALVKVPDLVAISPAVAMETALWFWKQNVHNRKGVANGNFGATTKAVHGAGACTDPKWIPNSKLRYELFLKCLKASGKFDKLEGMVNESGCYPV